jgi:hypothetical protein
MARTLGYEGHIAWAAADLLRGNVIVNTRAKYSCPYIA